MVVKDFSGDFLKFESTSDGDIFTILDEGMDDFNPMLNKTIFNLTVIRGDKRMKFSPNNSTGKQFQEAWGKDTKDWVNQKFECVHIDKALKIRPIKVIKV